MLGFREQTNAAVAMPIESLPHVADRSNI